jgi:hypothetical protein
MSRHLTTGTFNYVVKDPELRTHWTGSFGSRNNSGQSLRLVSSNLIALFMSSGPESIRRIPGRLLSSPGMLEAFRANFLRVSGFDPSCQLPGPFFFSVCVGPIMDRSKGFALCQASKGSTGFAWNSANSQNIGTATAKAVDRDPAEGSELLCCSGLGLVAAGPTGLSVIPRSNAWTALRLA